MEPEKTTFERLASQLPEAEKSALIQRLKAQRKPSGAPEAGVARPQREKAKPWQVAYQSLHPLVRFWLYITAMFSGQDLAGVVKHRQLKELAAKIHKTAPGVFDPFSRELRSPFFLAFKELWEAVKFFREPLQAALGGERKGFYAFILGYQLESLQAQLLAELDLDQQVAKDPSRPPREIRTLVENKIRDLLSSLDAAQRRPVYENIKALLSLFHLTGIPGERITQSFIDSRPDGTPDKAQADGIRGPLLELWDKLSGLVQVPTDLGFQALFLYHVQSQTLPEDHWEDYVSAQCEAAAFHLDNLRKFNNEIPLDLILLYLTGQEDLPISSTPGAEDWLNQAKKYWEKKLDLDFKMWLSAREEKQLEADIGSFLGLSKENWMAECPRAPLFSEELPLLGSRALGLLKLYWLREFHTTFVPVIQMILEEGDFAKKANRTALGDCLETLRNLPSKWQEFQAAFEPEGTWGALLQEVSSAGDPVAAKDRTQEILDMAASWFGDFHKTTLALLQLTLNLMKGLMTPSISAMESREFDTLTNLGQLGASKPHLLSRFESLINRWERLTRFFQELGLRDLRHG